MCLGAQKNVFFAGRGLPRNHGCAMEQNLDSFASRQASGDTRVIIRYRDLRGRCHGRHGNGAGFLRTLHLDAVTLRLRLGTGKTKST